MSYLFMLGVLTSLHSYDSYTEDYGELSEDEKSYLKYVDHCLYHESEKICNACSKMMFLILRLQTTLNTKEELTPEEIEIEKEKIMNGLSEDEIKIVDSFGYACIQTIGIYSEEKRKERKLKKEGKN